jgi:hypothetical protein
MPRLPLPGITDGIYRCRLRASGALPEAGTPDKYVNLQTGKTGSL